jgi:mannose-6-phosphate isomerase
MLYPIKFKPIYKDILWGGDNIANHFGRVTPFARVAESWELTCRDDGMSVVENGELAGKSMQALIDAYGAELLGKRAAKKYAGSFPLLIKLIDAADRLSVQVHPTDEYARRDGEENGKNEMWYIVDAKKDAKLIYGLKPGVTKKDFEAAVSGACVEQTLNAVPVKPGDFFFIPAGTVHAILGGILIAEIQQNSNTTYRIYDWNRLDKNGKGRALHIEKALDVIHFGRAQAGDAAEFSEEQAYSARQLLRSAYFNLDEIVVKTAYRGETDGESFVAAMILSGSGTLRYDGGVEKTNPGETILLPASLGTFEFSGSQKLLLTNV